MGENRRGRENRKELNRTKERANQTREDVMKKPLLWEGEEKREEKSRGK